MPKLLADRAKAVLDGDRAAFLATVDRRRTAYYRSQAALFTRLRTVPFSALDYRVTDERNLAPGKTVVTAGFATIDKVEVLSAGASNVI